MTILCYSIEFSYHDLLVDIESSSVLQLQLVSILRSRAARGFWVLGRSVEGLGGLRNIECRVLREETIGLEHDTNAFHRHNREVLNARVVGETECYKSD